MRGPDLLVVGAGIIGLWIAWRFLSGGWKVTVAEAGAVPNVGAASWDQHRLLHPFGAESVAGVQAIEAAMRGWEGLWARLGRTHYRETGGLLGDRIDACAANLEAAGWPIRHIDHAGLSSRIPELPSHPAQDALWTPRAGVLLADRIVTDMIALLGELGCRFLPGRRILESEIREGHLSLGEGHRSRPDRIVVAAGVDAGMLVRSIASRLVIFHQTMFYFSAPRAWESAPLLIDFGPSRDLWVAPPTSRTLLKLAASGLASERGRFDTQALSERIAGTFAQTGWRLERQARCRYGRTPNGALIQEPIAGTGGRAWVVAGCNGGSFKLAPLIAEEVWEQVTNAGNPAS